MPIRLGLHIVQRQRPDVPWYLPAGTLSIDVLGT
jgi:hypothetical protein